jgi:hypothetical protein
MTEKGPITHAAYQHRTLHWNPPRDGLWASTLGADAIHKLGDTYPTGPKPGERHHIFRHQPNAPMTMNERPKLGSEEEATNDRFWVMSQR